VSTTWNSQLEDLAAGRATIAGAQAHVQRIQQAQNLAVRTRDMLRDTLFVELTTVLNDPATTQRSTIEEIRDVADKSSSTAADETGDLVAITNQAVQDACLDRLATFTLPDDIFVKCYLRQNDMAMLLANVSEPLVHSHRWKAGMAATLFHMLELTMYVSPTGLPWITANVDLPTIGLVLPDSLAATIAGATSLTTHNDGALTSAYEQYANALAAMKIGDINRAFDIFINNRCNFLTLYNAYYSTNNTFTKVSDPKEAPISPASMGCGN
jgi:hypothetical protein